MYLTPKREAWPCNAHSDMFIREHGGLQMFSSIPTERRHQNFKRDLRNCFKGNWISGPAVAARGFAHLVSMDALDQGLSLC